MKPLFATKFWHSTLGEIILNRIWFNSPLLELTLQDSYHKNVNNSKFYCNTRIPIIYFLNFCVIFSNIHAYRVCLAYIEPPWKTVCETEEYIAQVMRCKRREPRGGRRHWSMMPCTRVSSTWGQGRGFIVPPTSASDCIWTTRRGRGWGGSPLESKGSLPMCPEV